MNLIIERSIPRYDEVLSQLQTAVLQLQEADPQFTISPELICLIALKILGTGIAVAVALSMVLNGETASPQDPYDEYFLM